MDSITDKRAHDRHKSKKPIHWSFFNANAYYEGTTVNYGQGGVSFESPAFVQPGTTIYIRQIASPVESEEDTYEGFPVAKIAEVRWCREMEGEDDRYLVGVKYQGLYDY